MSVCSKTCPCYICYVPIGYTRKNNRCGSPRRCIIWSIHVGVLQRTAKKCTNNYNARAKPLLCSLNLLFSGVLVAVAIVFCVRYTVSHGRVLPIKVFSSDGHHQPNSQFCFFSSTAADGCWTNARCIRELQLFRYTEPPILQR